DGARKRRGPDRRIAARFSGADMRLEVMGFGDWVFGNGPDSGATPKTQPLKPKAQSGFSLVEVLIALFITALLTALRTALVLGAVAGKARFDKVASGARGLELAHAALAVDLEQLSARVVRAPDGQRRPWIFSGGEATLDGPLLAFSRAGWENPG